MSKGFIGKEYAAGETIINENEVGSCMFVIQDGTVTVSHKNRDKEVFLAELGAGEFFGEMSLFNEEVRSATVRAKVPATILTIDRKTLLKNIQRDPTLAFKIIEKLSARLNKQNGILSRIKASDRRNWDVRPEEWP